jgi:2-amino-4-hydroxy-6-hydroxymethyldihydropteridine diphosphokinase
MNTITILLGGNIGNTQQYILDAEKLLIERIGPIQKSSSVYESEPWGFETEQWFLNKTIILQSHLQALKVLEICQDIEKQLGREKHNSTNYESRPIDIDILFFNEDIITEPNLKVPHPKLHLRRFTLMPLQEIMNDFIHPVLDKSIERILNECEDNGVCRKR